MKLNTSTYTMSFPCQLCNSGNFSYCRVSMKSTHPPRFYQRISPLTRNFPYQEYFHPWFVYSSWWFVVADIINFITPLSFVDTIYWFSILTLILIVIHSSVLDFSFGHQFFFNFFIYISYRIVTPLFVSTL